MDITPDGTLLTVPESVSDEIRSLHELIQGNTALQFIGPHGEEIVVSETLATLLQQAVAQLARGDAVSLIPAQKALSEVQAADMLNVSLAFYRKLLDQDEIPYQTVGTQRKVTFADLLVYQHERDAREREALNEITRLGQEMGQY